MKHTARIAAIIAIIVFALPASAINTNPEPPKEEPPVETPEPEPRAKAKPEPKAEPQRAERNEDDRECPHDELNKWRACLAPTVSLRPKARPVTTQVMRGEKHD
ncbi:hypothetical protein [uncultured Ruegeria sp.]|uniref:hypothetical protein n=1 Tax=uncultured Ruegeria sp. TaxID=259304 RepID=UPI0026078D7D|nr:hypothetical protein [uncultured Ruegeria sp.]